MQFGRSFLLGCLLSLSCSWAFAHMTTCPALELIQKKPGQNSWVTLIPGWEGRFDFPMIGQGYSSAVSQFIVVRWLQLNNLPDSPGKIECDYSGNYDSELIRFDQEGSYSTRKPISEFWVCQINPDFPSTVCECSMSLNLCAFDSDARQPRTSSVVEDVRTLLDQEFHK